MDKKLQEIFDRLMDKRSRKADLARAKARAELDTIQRETDAYYDGVYDALRAVEQVGHEAKEDAPCE